MTNILPNVSVVIGSDDDEELNHTIAHSQPNGGYQMAPPRKRRRLGIEPQSRINAAAVAAAAAGLRTPQSDISHSDTTEPITDDVTSQNTQLPMLSPSQHSLTNSEKENSYRMRRSKRNLNNDTSTADEIVSHMSTFELNESQIELPPPPRKRNVRGKVVSRGRRKNNRAAPSAASAMAVVPPLEAIEEPIRPGTIKRVHVINFLCHANFRLDLCSTINIITGNNGSGKSAIEAAISLVFGCSATKSGRGTNLCDLIQTGKDWAKISVVIANEGDESLSGGKYGSTSEITLERELRKSSGRSCSSIFRIRNDQGTVIDKGAKAMDELATALNIKVLNPCVVLKQDLAKKFLVNNPKSKFDVFMQASNLASFEDSIQSCSSQLGKARKTHSHSKEDFQGIANSYKTAESKFRKLKKLEEFDVRKEELERAIHWQRFRESEAILKENQKKLNAVRTNRDRLLKTKDDCESKSIDVEHKIVAKIAEKEDAEKPAQDLEPIANGLKSDIKRIKSEQKRLSQKTSQHERAVQRKHKEIKDKHRQIREIQHEMSKNDTAQKLAATQYQLEQAQNDLSNHRSTLNSLQSQPNDELGLRNLQQQRTALGQQRNELEQQRQGHQTSVNNAQRQQNGGNRIEAFKSSHTNNRYSNAQIIDALRNNERRFQHLPIGPLGQYVELKDQEYVQVVQHTIGHYLGAWVVSSHNDRMAFEEIARRCGANPKQMTIIVRSYNDRPHRVGPSHAPESFHDKPVMRILDLINISNPWAFNVLVDNTQCESVYAVGQLKEARDFSDQYSRQFHINCVYTLIPESRQSNGLFRITKSGRSTASMSVRDVKPLLSTDQSRVIAYYQHQKEQCDQQLRDLRDQLNTLENDIKSRQASKRQLSNQISKAERSIQSVEKKMDVLTRTKQDLELEADDDQQPLIDELNGEISDMQAEIAAMETSSQPQTDEMQRLQHESREKERQLKRIIQQTTDIDRTVKRLTREFNELKQQKKKLTEAASRLPNLKTKLDQQLQREESNFENTQQTSHRLEGTAQHCGLEPQMRRRYRSVTDIEKQKELIETQRATWEAQLGNPTDIKNTYERLKPIYESHEERVLQCQKNVEKFEAQLRDRTSHYRQMKAAVEQMICKQFHAIMSQQGHSGRLHIDYDSGELSLEVHMKGHDGSQKVSTKTLSGGEKSFTQVSLMMALQHFTETPFCIYDEFDVFMDDVNRGNSIRLLIDMAQRTKGRQYIFITPNDVSAAQRAKKDVNILKLQPPRKQ